MWNIGEQSISELLLLIKNSELGLPQFQRDEVWGKGDWVPFLQTILLGRPTGMLLLLESSGQRAFNPRALETAPPLVEDNAKWLLLDGQQRTTTLWRAAKGDFGKRPLLKVVVKVKDALITGELQESHLELRKKGEVQSDIAMAQEGTVDFATLMDPGRLETWRVNYIVTHYPGDEQGGQKFSEAVSDAMPGFASVGAYSFPVLTVKKQTPISIVAEIFEGMNRRGQPLSTFDLMVARLYQPLNANEADSEMFDLRERWKNALKESPSLVQLGVEENDGLLPLQLLAKQVSRNAGIRKDVRGLNKKDVLELQPAQVIGSADAAIAGLSLETATKALEAAARFLQQHCGVVAANLLPQQAMLLPIADQMLLASSRRLKTHQLTRWFFSVGLSGDYYGSVNSYANAHCDVLHTWAQDGDAPARVRELSREFIDDLNLQQAFVRDGNILGTTIMAFLVQSGALDWTTGQTRVSQADPIEFHHIVPEKRLSDWKLAKESRRPIAALTPISKSANAGIRNENPQTVMTGLSRDAKPIMKSHLIDSRLLETAYDSHKNFTVLCSDRELKIKHELISFLAL